MGILGTLHNMAKSGQVNEIHSVINQERASANTSAGRLSFTESDFDRGISNYHPSGKLCNYIIPIPGFPAGAAGIGSLIVATAASVVRKLLATLVAF